MVSKAAELKLPAQGVGSGLFVAELLLSASESEAVEIRYDQTQLQYAGSVQPNPDIQLRYDGVVEIASGSGERRYQFKYLLLPPHQSSVLTLHTRHGTNTVTVSRTATEAAATYHLHLLAIALLLLGVGVFLWKYQSRQVDLMSTRSLFYTYEELERLRREHETPAAPSVKETVPESTGPDARAEAPRVVAPEPPIVGAPLPSGSQEPAPITGPLVEHQKSVSEPAASEAGVSISPIKTASTGKESSPSLGASSESPTVMQYLNPFQVSLTDAQGRRFSGSGTEIIIGRRKDCQVVLTAAEVSRTHACIRRQGRLFELVPLAPTNLTCVNEVIVTQPVLLKSGDTISLGGAGFRVTIDE